MNNGAKKGFARIKGRHFTGGDRSITIGTLKDRMDETVGELLDVCRKVCNINQSFQRLHDDYTIVISEWIPKEAVHGMECSGCHFRLEDAQVVFRYCPCCGSQMENGNNRIKYDDWIDGGFYETETCYVDPCTLDFVLIYDVNRPTYAGEFVHDINHFYQDNVDSINPDRMLDAVINYADKIGKEIRGKVGAEKHEEDDDDQEV